MFNIDCYTKIGRRCAHFSRKTKKKWNFHTLSCTVENTDWTIGCTILEHINKHRIPKQSRETATIPPEHMFLTSSLFSNKFKAFQRSPVGSRECVSSVPWRQVTAALFYFSCFSHFSLDYLFTSPFLSFFFCFLFHLSSPLQQLCLSR